VTTKAPKASETAEEQAPAPASQVPKKGKGKKGK
jgi:hypothetical protein